MMIPDGLHVRYYHDRKYELVERTLESRGGRTYCYLEDENNNPVVTGIAYCSDKDGYNKQIGRAISLGRALKAYHEYVNAGV